MTKRKFSRVLIAALGVSLAWGSITPINALAQEATQTDSSIITQDDVDFNQAGETIEESTILEWVATDGSYSLDYQFRTVDGKKEVVIRGYGENKANSGRRSTTIVIPSVISAPSSYSNYADYQNVPVKSIYQNAFRVDFGCPENVTIPASVESIGVNAFTCGDSSTYATLKSLTIEENSKLTSIGDYAFQNQKLLAGNITIPAGVTEIGDQAFEGCASITGITFKGAGTIGDKAFYNCSGVTNNLVLPTGTTSIGESAFQKYGKTPLNITLPEGLKSIGKSAFYSAKLNGGIVIPSTVETMGDGAFNGAVCKSNNSETGTLTFAKSSSGTCKLTAIPNAAFNNCDRLVGSLTIPNTVTSIGDNAFQKCGFDGTLTLSTKLTSIGQSAFSSCSGFKGNLTIPDTVTVLEASAFYECSGFDGTIKISKNITTIPQKAFYNCSKLTGGLTLPTNLVSIGSQAFYGCSGLTGALNIPSKVTAIPKETFIGCSGFTSLTMPSGITTIGESAFSGCTGFANEFKLPTSLKTIGKAAFYECSKLTGNLVMPDTVTSVGASAFEDMTGLDGYLYISKNATTFGDNAFKNCSGLSNQKDSSGKDIIIEVAEGTKKLSQDMFCGCKKLTKILLPTTISEINSGAFADTNTALDVYVYSGSGAATVIREFTVNGKTFDIIYIDWLFKVVPTYTNMYVRTGGTRDITADIHYYKYNEKTGKDEEVVVSEEDADVQLDWSMKSEAIAKYKDGVITGVKAGSTTLTVIEPNTSIGATCTVRVVDSYVSGVSFDSTKRVYLDASDKTASDTVTATIKFQGLAEAIEAGEVTEEDVKIEWTQSKADTIVITPNNDIKFSDDYTKATVSATVKAKNSGTSSIKVVASVDGDNKTITGTGKSYQVVVPLESISIKENLTGKVGKYYTLGVTYNPSNATNQKVTWATEDPTVAKISSSGKVTFIGEGTTKITCTPKTTDGDTATAVECMVTVYPKDSTVVTDSDISSGDNNNNNNDDDNTGNVNVTYHTHIQSYGDSQGTKKNGEMAGTSGEAKRLENIWIDISGNSNLGVQYSTHCQSYGWMPWSCDGETNGTSGEAKRLEAIKIQLTGADKDNYDIYYRVHAQSYGWLGWAKNGEPSGTAGYAKRLEGIQVVVVKKGEAAPALKYAGVDGSSSKYSKQPYVAAKQETIVIPGNVNEPIVSYKTHVQSFGWQKWVYNGAMSGTSGQAKRLEGINIQVTNKPCDGDIVYTTHVQTYGWQGKPDDASRKGWKKNGEMSGTSGEAKRLEAICIDLTGEMGEKYDVYYRVHAQSFGWLGWAKNGEESGTAGYAKRLEGIQIVLVPAGGPAPANNYGGITSVDSRAYVEK